MSEDECRPWVRDSFLSDIPILTKNIRRLKQCLTCRRNPETCGCDDDDEDENGMCMKFARKEE